MTKQTYTLLDIKDCAYTAYTLLAGTVVYSNGYYTLPEDVIVDIEERGNTNYDNQRRCTINGLHAFWTKGKGIGD